jgi:RNA polymerase sigma-70 factor, ECF subfamily
VQFLAFPTDRRARVSGGQAATAELEPHTSPLEERGSIRGPDLGSDARLLERLRAGDEQAFETLVREQGGRLLAVARHFFDSAEDACDAVQEAFLSAFRSLPRFRGDSSLGTWLHRILVNAALMKLRSRARHPETPIEELLPRFDGRGHHVLPVEPWDSSRTSPEAAAGNGELRRTIRSCIARLPVGHRVVLILRDVEELSTAETAKVLALTPNAVKIRLHRARLALRELLAPHVAVRPVESASTARQAAYRI